MLKLNMDEHKFESLKTTELKKESILERYDLQEMIVNSWEPFTNEIGLPSSFLIGKEINPHPSTRDAIDLLAFDPNDSSIIVIELKRDKHKLHLLQALSYAAMISNWDAEQLISNIQKEYNSEQEELIDLINSNELNTDIKVILVGEYFDPEVIMTADWLSSNYSVDISAFAISTFKMDNDTFLAFDQRFPLKGLSDVYEARAKKRKTKRILPDITWDEVIPKLKYSFGEKGIRLCQNIREGDPSRRRFGSLRTNFDGFTWISLNFRQNYINVYMKGDFDNVEEFLQSKFKDPIEIKKWRDGYSIFVDSESKFNDLTKWLNIL